VVKARTWCELIYKQLRKEKDRLDPITFTVILTGIIDKDTEFVPEAYVTI